MSMSMESMANARPAARKARLTVVETVYHRSSSGEPIAVDSKFGRDLLTDDQPYKRVMQVGEAWERVEIGWLSACSTLVVRNEEGQFSTYPTPEERAESDARIVCIGYDPNSSEPRDMHSPPKLPIAVQWLVPPGETFRGMPADVDKLRIRCAKGRARVTLTAMPL